MKEYYGAMLDKGATTFWEDFNIDWLENTGNIDEILSPDQRDLHGDNGAFCYIGYTTLRFPKKNCGELSLSEAAASPP